MRCARAPTASCSTRSSSSPARRTRPTTTRAATTPSARRSSTSCSTASASWPTSAPVSRASSSSTRSAVAPARLHVAAHGASLYAPLSFLTQISRVQVDYGKKSKLEFSVYPAPQVSHCSGGAVQLDPDDAHDARALGLRLHGGQRGHLRHLPP